MQNSSTSCRNKNLIAIPRMMSHLSILASKFIIQCICQKLHLCKSVRIGTEVHSLYFTRTISYNHMSKHSCIEHITNICWYSFNTICIPLMMIILETPKSKCIQFDCKILIAIFFIFFLPEGRGFTVGTVGLK